MTNPNPTLPVASYFLRHIPGWGGRAISAMQGFVRGGSYWTHAGMILDRNQFIQGQPGGAAIYDVDLLFDGQPLLVSDAPIQEWAGSAMVPGMIAVKRAEVAAAARALEHVKYSYLDYPALGVAEWARTHPDSIFLKHLSEYLRDRINSGGHLICSALVDRGYLNGGVHLYTDKRMPGDVTPEDLANYAYMNGRKPLIDTSEGETA